MRGTRTSFLVAATLLFYVLALAMFYRLSERMTCEPPRPPSPSASPWLEPTASSEPGPEPEIPVRNISCDGHASPIPWNCTVGTTGTGAMSKRGLYEAFLDDAIEPLVPSHLLRHPNAVYLKPRVHMEDRTYLRHLAATINCETGTERRILIDVGAAEFDSSIGWFMDNYPCRFTHIFAFEPSSIKFRPPISSRLHQIVLSFYPIAAALADTWNTTDFLRVLRSDVRLSLRDYVVLKIDVENDEWTLLPALMQRGIFDYIDEFYVEIHFAGEPAMVSSDWERFTGHSICDAYAVLKQMRECGVVAHYWP